MKFEKKNFLREGSASPVGCVRNVSQHAPAPGLHDDGDDEDDYDDDDDDDVGKRFTSCTCARFT